MFEGSLKSRVARASAAMVLSFSFIGVAQAEVGVTDTEIVIGNHSIQSGRFSVYGVTQRVMKAYLDSVNEKGGVHGRKFRVIMEDNAGNSLQALQVTKKMVEVDKIFAFLGAGPTHQGVFNYLRQKQVPDLWIADSLPIFTTPHHKLSFNYNSTYAIDGDYWGKFVSKKFPGKKVGLLVRDDIGGQSAAESFKKSATGVNVVRVESIDLYAADTAAKAQMLNLKRAGAEVVYMAAPAPIAPAAMKFSHEQGFRPQWILAFINTHKAIIDLAGKEVIEGAYSWSGTYTEAETNVPEVKKHIEFLKAKLPNEKPSIGSINGQALGELTVETFKRAGKNLTRESIVAAAESIKDFKCSVCRFPNSVTPDNHVYTKTVGPLIMKNGDWIPFNE